MRLKTTQPCAAAILLWEAFVLALSSHYIDILRGEATVVQGTLQGVQWGSRGRTGSAYGLELYVDGQEYAIIRYSATSSVGRLNSGIEGDGTVEDVRFLLRRLREKIGWKVRLEYVYLAEKDKQVVRLTVDGKEYIDEAEARRDFIRFDEAGRDTWMLFGVAALGTWCAVFTHALQEERDKRFTERKKRSVS